MSVKFYLVASLLLVISEATGGGLTGFVNYIYIFINISDLPAEGGDVLDPNVQVGLQNNINDVWQKREAGTGQRDKDVKEKGSKNTKGERKSSTRNSKSWKRKVSANKNSERKRKTAKRQNLKEKRLEKETPQE